MTSLAFGAVLIAVFGASEVIGLGDPKGEWNCRLNKLLLAHLQHYNGKSVEALASEYEADGHRLVPGKPVAIGRKAIKDSYREEVAKKSLKKLEVTEVRFACGEGAVAEISIDFGEATGKGVILVKMVDGVAKISTLIYNMDG